MEACPLTAPQVDCSKHTARLALCSKQRSAETAYFRSPESGVTFSLRSDPPRSPKMEAGPVKAARRENGQEKRAGADFSFDNDVTAAGDVADVVAITTERQLADVLRITCWEGWLEGPLGCRGVREICHTPGVTNCAKPLHLCCNKSGKQLQSAGQRGSFVPYLMAKQMFKEHSRLHRLYEDFCIEETVPHLHTREEGNSPVPHLDQPQVSQLTWSSLQPGLRGSCKKNIQSFTHDSIKRLQKN
uniref:Uncharacterized protein n=1 Tax=Branchiostoma floridae TaxID=7739 RepID=C3ZSA0_BRAFL|eukprot:XP_002588574.1 hypothetical protein BRAFLDRAFT_132822 [Branchiostoma floridae]